MKNQEALKLYNSIKKATIESRKDVELPQDLESGKMFLDFMTEKYFLDHSDFIEFMSSEEIFKLVKSKYPENENGYLEVFVKKEGKKFIPYLVKFTPYHIIPKYWGLGFQNTKQKDFMFVECLYFNDFTKFRACYKK